MLHTDLPIYKKGYDLLSLAADVQLNMPRTFKQSLGKRVHDECVDLLLEIGYANASRGEKRCEHIRNVLRGLEVVSLMMRIYISGPMTGIPAYNFPAFNAEAERLRSMGYDVVNPAEINTDTSTPYNECMRNDLKALLDCDTIAMLDGWMDSNGAHLEMHIAHRVGIRVVESRAIVDPALEMAA